MIKVKCAVVNVNKMCSDKISYMNLEDGVNILNFGVNCVSFSAFYIEYSSKCWTCYFKDYRSQNSLWVYDPGTPLKLCHAHV